MTLAVPMIEVYCKQHYHTPYDAENHLVITLGNLTKIRGGLVVPVDKHGDIGRHLSPKSGHSHYKIDERYYYVL